jgi:hypothetical protein
MAKPVAVFRSGVIGDSRHTVRLDENSQLVLFPSFSRYITSWAISATWPVEAPRSRCYRPGSGIWLVAGWLPCSWGLDAGSGWSLRPPTAIYRLYLEAHFTYNWESGVLSVQGASKNILTDLGVVGWFLGGPKSTRVGQIFV